jgi:hypothetical protein
MAGTLSNGPQSPDAAFAKRRRAAVVAILTVIVAAMMSVSHILAGSPLSSVAMCLAWFSACFQCSWWMILNERCRNIEQAQ